MFYLFIYIGIISLTGPMCFSETTTWPLKQMVASPNKWVHISLDFKLERWSVYREVGPSSNILIVSEIPNDCSFFFYSSTGKKSK